MGFNSMLIIPLKSIDTNMHMSIIRFVCHELTSSQEFAVELILLLGTTRSWTVFFYAAKGYFDNTTLHNKWTKNFLFSNTLLSPFLSGCIE